MRLSRTLSTIAVLLVAVVLSWPALMRAQTTALNYFSPCSAGASSCDNILNLGGTWKIGTTSVTASAAELNALASTGLDSTELGYLNAVTAGTPAASKALVTDANVAVGPALKIALGGSATTTAGGSVGSLNDSTSTASGTVQNTEYTLNSVTLLGSAFNAATRGIECEAWGTSAGNANAKNYKFYFGSTAIVTLTGTTDSAKDYYAKMTVLRVSSNAQTGVGSITSDAGAPDAGPTANGAIAETESGSIVIAFKSANTAAAAASATGKGLKCTFLN